MIVLDTNVVSEAMKPEPHPAVRAWLNGQAAETLYLSSGTPAELPFGIAAIPAGKRKHMLARTLDGLGAPPQTATGPKPRRMTGTPRRYGLRRRASAPRTPRPASIVA